MRGGEGRVGRLGVSIPWRVWPLSSLLTKKKERTQLIRCLRRNVPSNRVSHLLRDALGASFGGPLAVALAPALWQGLAHLAVLRQRQAENKSSTSAVAE